MNAPSDTTSTCAISEPSGLWVHDDEVTLAWPDGRLWWTKSTRTFVGAPWAAVPDDRYPGGGQLEMMPGPAAVVRRHWGHVLLCDGRLWRHNVGEAPTEVRFAPGTPAWRDYSVSYMGALVLLAPTGELWQVKVPQDAPTGLVLQPAPLRAPHDVRLLRHAMAFNPVPLAVTADAIWTRVHDRSLALSPLVRLPPELGAVADVQLVDMGLPDSGYLIVLDTSGRLWATGALVPGMGRGQKGFIRELQPITAGLDTPLPRRFTAISCAVDHCLALEAHGTVWGWGNNRDGAVGDGSSAAEVLAPVMVMAIDGWPLTDVVAVAAGDTARSAAYDSSDRLHFWGRSRVCPAEVPREPGPPSGAARYAIASYLLRAKFGGQDGDWDEEDFTEAFEYFEGEDVRALAKGLPAGTLGGSLKRMNVRADVPRPPEYVGRDSDRGRALRERAHCERYTAQAYRDHVDTLARMETPPQERTRRRLAIIRELGIGTY